MAGLLNFEVPGGMNLWDYVKQRANDPLVPPPTSRMIQNDMVNKGMEAVGFAPLGITKYEKALEAARKNAVKMLGLPENNTAIDRAKALGFDTHAYHGSAQPYVSKRPQIGRVTTSDDAVASISLSKSPSVASGYAQASDDIVKFSGNAKMLDIFKNDPNKAKELSELFAKENVKNA